MTGGRTPDIGRAEEERRCYEQEAAGPRLPGAYDTEMVKRANPELFADLSSCGDNLTLRDVGALRGAPEAIRED